MYNVFEGSRSLSLSKSHEHNFGIFILIYQFNVHNAALCIFRAPAALKIWNMRSYAAKRPICLWCFVCFSDLVKWGRAVWTDNVSGYEEVVRLVLGRVWLRKQLLSVRNSIYFYSTLIIYSFISYFLQTYWNVCTHGGEILTLSIEPLNHMKKKFIFF